MCLILNTTVLKYHAYHLLTLPFTNRTFNRLVFSLVSRNYHLRQRKAQREITFTKLVDSSSSLPQMKTKVDLKRLKQVFNACISIVSFEI